MSLENGIEIKKINYSYNDGDLYYFIDDEFDIITLAYDQIKDQLKYLKTASEVTIKLCNGNVLSVELEDVVELNIIDAEPSISLPSGTKSVTLETGITIQAPTYLEIGDVVRINTKTGRLV